ncbi:hypothetical protein C1922_05795 [Stenotrophomonas sp. ZAC14D2_NAIMI4_7]|uniref:hypothetical protein n=1 Tax=Stenotrophomonas sp. ZAC14D2_NAIMI4_7 TaxID=2072405 RepID=UPI000D53E584|nr:hypothetical protein [Stenotrophomonas sp. ZAC14D2_NAIMI4_7]AWH16865.1 hypothetical protein C1922_05795 [Stenotrophomonas sp. ZAC14D2_NAIMI4_7]
MLVVTVILIALVLGLNLVATFVVVGRDELSVGGRLVQLLLVWLLPLLGAILCMAASTSDGSSSRADGSGGGSYTSSDSGSSASSDCGSDSGSCSD